MQKKCNKTKFPCRNQGTESYVARACGLGRKSRLNDLKYIIDPILPCDVDSAPCQYRETWLEKTCFRYVFPTILCCREIALIIYFMFVLLATFTISYTYAPAFWFTNEVEKNFIDKEIESSGIFSNDNTISKTSDFWNFLGKSFLNNKYWVQWLESNRTNHNNSIDSYLFGVPRIRQTRQIDASKLSDQCNEIEQNILLENAKRQCQDIIDLSLDRQNTLQIVDNLKTTSWISNTTKSLYLTFTMYNANTNYFCIVKLIFDRPVTGGIISSRIFYTVRLLPYLTIFDHVILGFQIVFVISIIYFIIVEIVRMSIYKRKYWCSCWNYITLFTLCLAIACIIMHLLSLGWAKTRILLQQGNPGAHVDFTGIGSYIVKIHVLSGIVIFLIWFKIFHFVKFIYPMNILNLTLSRNKRVLFGFVINFLLVYISFAILGFLLFGSQVISFSKFEHSLFSLLKSLMGEFVFEDIRTANGYWGYIFFIVYIIIVFFMLMNMLIAIIGDNYQQAMKYEKDRDKECAKYCMRFKSRCCRSRKNKTKKPTNLIKLLKTCSYTDKEICEAFEKYNLDPTMDISKYRVKQFLTELLTHKYNFYEAANYVREKHTNKIYITLDEYELQEAELSRLARNIEMLSCRLESKTKS